MLEYLLYATRTNLAGLLGSIDEILEAVIVFNKMTYLTMPNSRFRDTNFNRRYITWRKRPMQDIRDRQLPRNERDAIPRLRPIVSLHLTPTIHTSPWIIGSMGFGLRQWTLRSTVLCGTLLIPLRLVVTFAALQLEQGLQRSLFWE